MLRRAEQGSQGDDVSSVTISRSDLRRLWEFARESPRYVTPEPEEGESWDIYCARRRGEEQFLARMGVLSIEKIVCEECGATFGPDEHCAEEAVAHVEEHAKRAREK